MTKFRNFALGSAAVLALAALAAPGLAQQSYSTNPTPEERAQTNALNQQANDNAMTDTGQPGSVADAQYQAQMDQYREQQKQYGEQKAEYQNRLAHYEYDRSHPGYWWHTRYARASLDSFYRLPHHDLIDKQVDESDGLRVGRIRDVERASDGRVERVDVALNDHRAIWIEAPDLRYDADAGVMFTDVPVGELYDRSRGDIQNPRP